MNSDLQHGLVRWVQNYGEHILKILIARSPKLPHSRRLSSTVPATPPSQNGHMSPRQLPASGGGGGGGRQDSGGKPRRFNSNVRGGMLQPPYPHGQFPPHNYHLGGSPTSTFYNLVPHSQSQLSPPTGGLPPTATPPTNHGYPGNLVMHMAAPHGGGGVAAAAGISPQGMGVGQPGGLVYPMAAVVPLDSSVPNQPTPPPQTTSTQPSSPILSSQPSVGGMVSKSDGAVNVRGGEGGVYFHPHQTQGLISTFNPLMATTGPPISGSSPSQAPPPPPPQLSAGVGGGGASLGQFEQQGMPGQHPNVSTSSVFPLTESVPATASSGGHFLPGQAPPPPLTISTPLPPPHLPLHPAIAHTTTAAGGHAHHQGGGAESEPLLPNPPLPPSVPLMPPLVHPIPPSAPQPTLPATGGNGGGFPQQQGGSPLSSRKEILCRHYMLQGFCPFGEKCWFAHPEPAILAPMGGNPPRGSDGGLPGGGGGGGAPHPPQGPPLHVQVPPNFWPAAVADYTTVAAASPPQSPINPALVPRSPIIPAAAAAAAAMFRPRGGAGGVAFPGQPPMYLLRNPLTGNPRLPGPLIPTAPIPPQVNPILKFTLLSQVVIQAYGGAGEEGGGDSQEEGVVSDISQLATFADHFYVSYSSNINTYRIIFGGNRNYQVRGVAQGCGLGCGLSHLHVEPLNVDTLKSGHLV